jgi:thiol-disulfide isomerase/thioredoxin
MKPALIGLIALVVVCLLLLKSSLTKVVDNFEGSIGETNSRGTFTLYYADWCPHCKTIQPVFKDFMGNGSVSVNGAYVKCKMVEEKQIQRGVDPEVKGYPTLLYSDAAGKVVEFSGPRTSEGFLQFLKQQILA